MEQHVLETATGGRHCAPMGGLVPVFCGRIDGRWVDNRHGRVDGESSVIAGSGKTAELSGPTTPSLFFYFSCNTSGDITQEFLFARVVKVLWCPGDQTLV